MEKLEKGNHQLILLTLNPLLSKYNVSLPRFTMSITFVHGTENSTVESCECDDDHYSNNNFLKGSTLTEKVKEQPEYICPVTFRMDTYQFSYVLSQICLRTGHGCYPPFRCCRGHQCDDERIFLFTIALYQPVKHFLDYRSNDITTMLMVEKRELEHSLNWLSTLGGAFSALGEEDDSFAKRAGKVSRGQMLIAFRLGSSQTMSRCRMYAAISLLQLGMLQAARKILKREWAYINSLPPDSDVKRLQRMCLGVWCKLQWVWKQKKKKAIKENGTTTSNYVIKE